MRDINYKYKKKKIIVFAFEGKSNKTETLYFSHFKPCNSEYLLKRISSGCTDPQNMLNSVKSKRKSFDYNPREDMTFIFIDIDGKIEKIELIEKLRQKAGKDVHLIVSSPCFEIWFLNHFKYTCKDFENNDKLIKELKTFLPDYRKSMDVYELLSNKFDKAIKNCILQYKEHKEMCATDVFRLFIDKIIEEE